MFKFQQSTTYNIIYNGIIPVYIICIFLLHFLYFLYFFKFVNINIEYINGFNLLIEIFICLFLIIKFFPLTNHVFYKQDSIIIFGCALFLLFHIGFGKFIDSNILHRSFFTNDS